MSLFSHNNADVRQLDSYFCRLKSADASGHVYVYKTGTASEFTVTLPKKPITGSDFYDLASFIRNNIPATLPANEATAIRQFASNLLVDAAIAGNARAKKYLEFVPHSLWDSEKRNCFIIQYPREIKSAYQLSRLRTTLAAHQAQLESLELMEIKKGHDPLAQTLVGDFYKVTTTAADLKQLLICFNRKISEAQKIERVQLTKAAYQYAKKVTAMNSFVVEDKRAALSYAAEECSSYLQKLLFTYHIGANTQNPEPALVAHEPSFALAFRRNGG